MYEHVQAAAGLWKRSAPTHPFAQLALKIITVTMGVTLGMSTLLWLSCKNPKTTCVPPSDVPLNWAIAGSVFALMAMGLRMAALLKCCEGRAPAAPGYTR